MNDPNDPIEPSVSDETEAAAREIARLAAERDEARAIVAAVSETLHEGSGPDDPTIPDAELPAAVRDWIALAIEATRQDADALALRAVAEVARDGEQVAQARAEVARLTAERQALTAERAELLLRVDRLEAEARATAARDEMAAEHTRQLGEAIGEPALSWGAAIDRARLLWEFVRLDERHADKAHALLNAGAWAVGLDLPGRVQAVLDRVRTLEEQLAGAREQAEEARAELARVRAERPRPLTPAAIERAHAALVRVRDAERELAELGVVAHG